MDPIDFKIQEILNKTKKMPPNLKLRITYFLCFQLTKISVLSFSVVSSSSLEHFCVYSDRGYILLLLVMMAHTHYIQDESNQDQNKMTWQPNSNTVFD